MAAETATNRLARLLTMVPWLVNRQGIALEEAADGLGVSVAQLEADLNLLFLCGYGQMPDELIEADWEEGRVFVGNADTISRPLRLGVDEAVTLIVGLRTLLDVPGLTDQGAIERALAKLESAAGTAAEPAARVSVDLAGRGVDDEVLSRARQGVQEDRRLHLTYHVPGRDESTERDVDPMRVIAADGHWYLEGWCHRAEGVRIFRLDRVEDLTVLDEDGTPPEGVAPRDIGESIFSPAEDDLLVTVRLLPGALWVSDYYPVESATDAEDGSRTITLRTADTAWIERLVLRMGGHAVVLSPQDLSERIVSRAMAALEPQTHDVD
ncbi:helix-turn-helix transcriptional regulator [Knoellia subterranea]|uniref:Proteasome accessory factor C n=1 Tax=Knoellia subterranea KCTC 19937 TaxID=1385521 RepID=A0A0A0JRJ6_9MICO|nr:WYL domain-containing protein [Knoellia subterranea]KGN38677.1 proteasome accessory factor C [Knoellia subterranea KCTC 19937]